MKNRSAKFRTLKSGRAGCRPFLLSAFCFLLCLLGCTIKPAETLPRQASFDVGGQNSGFLGWTTNGYGILTSHARDRYNALIAAYGQRFQPPLAGDDGIMHPPLAASPAAPGSNWWWITPRALVNFETMNRWKKEGVPPPSGTNATSGKSH